MDRSDLHIRSARLERPGYKRPCEGSAQTSVQCGEGATKRTLWQITAAMASTSISSSSLALISAVLCALVTLSSGGRVSRPAVALADLAAKQDIGCMVQGECQQPGGDNSEWSVFLQDQLE